MDKNLEIIQKELTFLAKTVAEMQKEQIEKEKIIREFIDHQVEFNNSLNNSSINVLEMCKLLSKRIDILDTKFDEIAEERAVYHAEDD